MTPTAEIKLAEPCNGEILKTDAKGRIRLRREKRQELLAEFERSGMSGAEFAKWCGVKYTTFCGWRQSLRREKESVPEAGRPMKWVEAVVDHGSKAAVSAGIVMHIGTIRVDVGDAKTAAELLQQLGVKRC
jgi:hypothetical protein